VQEQGLTTKWVLVGVLILAAGLLVWPPDEKIKYGIDLQGGTSLLYEIDTTGLSEYEQRDLSERVMSILKDRVDPTGSLNLIWRPVGATRLEIQMPQPSEKAKKRRDAKNEAEAALKALNIEGRFSVEQALAKSGAEREAALDALVKGVPTRKVKLLALRVAHDARAADPGDADKVRAYEDAFEAVMDTNLNVQQLNDVLALKPGPHRDQEIGKLRAKHPAYEGLIDAYKSAYDLWARDKAALEDPSDLKRLLRGAGVLEFRILAERDPASPAHTKAQGDPQLRLPIADFVEELERRGPRPKAGDRYRWFPIKDLKDFMNLETDAEVLNFDETMDSRAQIVAKYAGRYYVLAHNDADFGLLRPRAGSTKRWKLTQARPDRDYDTGRNSVSFTLDAPGGDLFGELTGANVGRQLAIVLDGEMMSHATIQSRIGQRGQITGNFSRDDVADLVRVLEAGALPGRLKETPLMEKTVGPSIGADNREKGINASVWGFILVVVFIVFYYGLAAGLVADLALLMNLVLVLGIMAMLQATFTLPGIAGLILTVGMAIDANVLIFERVREERDRGVVFKKALNLGYEKALSTIVDANLTTMIICVILGYVGSEEVKGFAITLGLGIATSMFTALYVTRLVFTTLIARGVLSDFSMRRLIKRPSIDWLALRRYFWPISFVAVAAGLAFFLFESTTNPDAMFDIEFLGGTSVQVDFKEDATLPGGGEIRTEQVRAAITGSDRQQASVANWLDRAALELMEGAVVGSGTEAGQYTLTSDRLTGDQMRALTMNVLEARCDSIVAEGNRAIYVARTGMINSPQEFKALVQQAAAHVRDKVVSNLRGAKVQSVSEGELPAGQKPAPSFEIVTVETDRGLVQEAIVAVLGDQLKVDPAINFNTRIDDALTQEPFFAIRQEARYMSDVIGGDSNYDIHAYKGGVAIVVEDLDPPLTRKAFEQRLREASLRPEVGEAMAMSRYGVLPLSPEGPDQTCTEFAVLMVSEDLLYTDEDEDRWIEFVAQPALEQVKDSLAISKSLRKVVQFAPQVAGAAKQNAMAAIILALAAIVAYVWIRFGTMQYGLAGIVALVHDVVCGLGAVTLADFLADTALGSSLGLVPMKIDLPMVAALLTLIGYSLNDTIVIFDRIRENKGKATTLTAALINQSINETLSRTVLTSLTTFIVVIMLYLFGGPGIRGFAFVLGIGLIVGTYSTVAIATPLLYRPLVLGALVRMIVAVSAIGMVFVATPNWTARLVLSLIIAAATVLWMVRANAPTRRGGRLAVAT